MPTKINKSNGNYVPTLEEYISDQINLTRNVAVNKSLTRTMPRVPKGIKRGERWNPVTKKVEPIYENGNSCAYTFADNYNQNWTSSEDFRQNHDKYGFKEVNWNDRKAGDAVLVIGNDNVAKHTMMYDSDNSEGQPLYNHSNGGSDEYAIRKKAKYPVPLNNKLTYTYVGTQADSTAWVNQYNQLYGNQMKCGGRRKAQLGLAVTDGGTLTPIGPNMYLAQGRTHDDGGIGISYGKKYNAGGDLEIEDKEILQVVGGNTKFVGNGKFKSGGQEASIRVFSSVPFLRGVSPAQLVLGGANPDAVFKAQEEFKDKHRINDDGTTYENGGEKIINLEDVPSSFRGKKINGRFVQFGIPPAVNKAHKLDINFKQRMSALNDDMKDFIMDDIKYGYNIMPNPLKKYYLKGVDILNIPGVKDISNAAQKITQVQAIVDEKKMGGLSRSEDYGSKKKPYPSVSKSDFAGGHRSYPIPTKADAVDALRLAELHSRSDVKAKVYRKYPELRKKKELGGEENVLPEVVVTAKKPKTFFEKLDDYANIGEKALAIPNLALSGATLISPNPFTAVGSYITGLGGAAIDIYQGARSAYKGDWFNVGKNAMDIGLSLVGLRALKNAKKLNELDKSLEASGAAREYVTKYVGRGRGRHKATFTKEKSKAIKEEGIGYGSIPGGTALSMMESNRKKKEFGGSMIYTINGNVKNGLSLRPKATVGTKKEDEEKKKKNPNEARYASLVKKGQSHEVTPKPVVEYNEATDKNPDKYRYTRAAGFKNEVNKPSTGDGTQSKDGRWIGQYKTTSVGDWIGLGTNVLGSIGSYLLTKKAIDKTPEPIKPIMAQAAKLKTKYNIEPQLAESREAELTNRRAVRSNTQSSNTSLAREQRLMNEARNARNTFYGQKENIETQLINQDKLNRQSVMADNIRTYNDYLNRVYANKLNKNQLKISNINNLISGLTSGVNSILSTVDNRRMTNNTLRAIAAANPNVDARLIGGFDYYIDPITKKKYNKYQQYVGTING